jgi:hypothetical protein
VLGVCRIKEVSFPSRQIMIRRTWAIELEKREKDKMKYRETNRMKNRCEDLQKKSGTMKK